MKITTLIILVWCLSSCTNEEGQLLGHWHIYGVGNNNPSIGEYSTIDIRNDTLAIFNKGIFSDYSLKGSIDHENKTMLFGGECRMLDFRYRLVEDKLLLNKDRYDEETDISFVGKKCDSLCCDLQEDFFKSILLKVDLPSCKEDKKSLKSVYGMKQSLLRSVYVGKIKRSYHHLYPDEYMISLGGQEMGLEKVEEWRERCLIKIPENQRALSRSVIYADRHTPKAELIEVVETLLKSDDKPIYLALKNDRGKFEIMYLTLHSNTFKENIELYF